MAKVFQEFEFNFKFNDKDASKSIKTISKDLKQMIANFGDASDKISVLKDLVGYLNKVDASLNDLKTNNKDLFNQIFGSVDKNLTGALSELFGVLNSDMTMLDGLKQRVQDANDSRAKLDVLKRIAEDINSLYEKMGAQKPINIDEMFVGKGSKQAGTDFASRIRILNDAINGFAVNFQDVQQKLKDGFTIGGAGGTGGSGQGNSFETEVQNDIDKLKELRQVYQEIVDAIKGNPIKIEVSKKNDADELSKLINEYQNAISAYNDIANKQNATPDEINEKLAERLRLATLLVNMSKDIESSGSDKAGELVTFNLKTIENAREFLMGLKDTQKKAIENLYNNKLQQIDVDILKKEYLSYDSLYKKVEELYSLKEKMSKLDKTKDKSQYDALDEEYGKINDDLIKIASAMEVDDAVADIFDEIYDATIDKQKAIEKLCKVFNISTQDTGIPSKSANGGQETGDNDSDADDEAEAYGRLQTAIENVKAAVEEKTKAFKDEASTVDTVVNQEIESLTRLKEHLQLIQNIVQELFYEKKPNIAFHAGDLDYYAKTGLKSERLGGSGTALVDGYGAYGTGIYTVSNPNAYLKNKENWSSDGSKIYAIDLSKYNMFTAQTSEQAEQLYNFLAKLEKFVLASSGFKGFDDQLDGINIDSLYAEMQNVFKDTIMPMERLQKFVNDMKQLIAKMGIDKLDSANIKLSDLDVLNSGDRVSTQFMKMLGYQGVNVKGTSSDNTSVGSVIYDLDQSSPYIKAFDSINEAIEYYNQNLSQSSSIQTTFSSTVQTLTEGLEQVCQTIQNMPMAIGEFSTALQPIMQALPNMVSDANNLRDAINNIGNGIDQDALQSISDTLSNMEQSAKNLKETLSSLGDNFGAQGESALNVKFGDTLKVDLQADSTGILQRISEAVAAIQAKINAQGADDRQGKVDAMKNNLTQLFKYISDFNNKKNSDGTYQGQEIGAAILSDGSISTGFGEKGEVPWKVMASSLVANLTKTLLMDLHSHPLHQFYDGSTFVSDFFSGSSGDLGAFRLSKEIGAQLASMLTGNIMRVLDLSKLTDEQMQLFRAELADIEKTYPNKPEFSPYASYDEDDGKLAYYKQGNLSDQHTVTNVFEHFMYEAFERIGLSKDYIDQNIFKKYDLTDDKQLTALAERLVDLALASQNALSPVERLTQIVEQFGYYTNSKSAKAILEGFKKGELTAADAFNQLTNNKYNVNQDTMDSLFTIDSANEMSTVESLLTQITGVLDAIKSNVANIDGNTSRDSSEQIDRAISDILDIKSYYGLNGYDYTPQNLISDTKSNVNPLNISQYRNQEMLDIARQQYDNLTQSFSYAADRDLNVAEAQIILDNFKATWRAIDDAIQTVSLYEKRTGEQALSEDSQEVMLGTLDQMQQELFSGSTLDEMLRILRSAKTQIDTRRNELSPSSQLSESSNSELESDSNGSTLSSILSTLETIKSSVSSIEQNTYKGQAEQFDSAINDLLSLKDSILGQIADYGFVVEKPLYFGAQSTIDPNNVPDSETTLDLFRKTRSSVIDFLDSVELISDHNIADLPVDWIQNFLNDFKKAWQLLHDSAEAIDLNPERSDDPLTDRERERWSDRLSGLTKDLIGDGGANINLLLQMLTQAKNKIEAERKNLLSSGEPTGNKASVMNDSQDITGLLDRIADAVEAIQTVVQKDTGIESDGKNSIKQTEPAIDNRVEQNKLSEQNLAVLGELSEVLGRLNEYLAANTAKETPNNENNNEKSGYALESTLQTVKGVLDTISGNVEAIVNKKLEDANANSTPSDTGADATKDQQNNPENNWVNTLTNIERILGQILTALTDGTTLSTLVQPLSDAVSALKDVSNGIIQHQKAQKSDTRVAQARIADPAQQDLIIQKAQDAVQSLGTDVQIASLDALADGVVRVSGAVQNANGIWEGFTVKVNQADEAVDLSIKKQSAFAKSLNKIGKPSGGDDEDSNPYVYDKAEVEARAKKHLDEYAAQGKNATVQFKDSGRYTITILEEIDGLSKQIFQTFDENDDKIERTTVTMSNSQKEKLDRLQKKLIDNGITNGLISDQDKEYQDYQAASDALNNMTDAYSKMDSLTDEQIEKWKQQITLVQQLGGQVEALIKQRKSINDTKIFESDRSKKLSRFDLDRTKLQKDINIPDSFKQQIEDARTAIESAADEDALKIAINNWEALKNQIHQTAVEQDLYIEKSKNTNTAPDQFTRDLKSQKTSFGKYKRDIEDAIDVTDELKNRLKNLETELANINDDAGLSAWQKKFNSLKTEITTAQSSYKRDKDKYSQRIMGQANAGLKSAGIKKDSVNPTEDQQKIIDKYNELEEQVNKYNEKVNAKQQAETSGIEQTKAALLDLIAAYKQANNIVDAKGNPSKQAYGTAQLQNFSAKYNSLQDRAQDVGLGEDYEAVKNLANAYQQLKDAQSKFQVGEDLTTEAGKQKVEEFKRAQIECNRYAQELNKVVTQEEKLRTNSVGASPVAEDFKDTLQGRKKALEDFVNAIPDTAIGKFNADFTELTYTVKNGDGTFTNMTATLNAARSAIFATAGETEKATTAFGKFWNELKGKMKGIATYLLSMTGFQEVWQQIRQGVQYVREIDAALTELKKVTDETNATYDAFLQTAAKTAGVIGSTVSEFTNATADFARLGYNLAEATELAKAASVYKNVGDGITDISQASESIISTMKAFGIEAEGAMGIVDRFNQIGNNFAISSTGIGEALQRSASALYEAGNTIDESIALVTAANSVGRSS